ncbi:uncharacterized protein KRP23_4499 [Phytophthora ramorum]|uniref:uncharacterized protein n=1 Tax=Phytophthora ramorum TaxID=164328 RepID=UPI0030A4C4F7|nr:hypothetical protein KRP23_4499 [Phytophthora ramorum]
MVSSTSFFAAAAVVAMSADYVQAHGYMEKPLAEFKEGTESPSAWVVELEPQWKGNWDEAKGDEGLVALYKELKASNNIKDIRTMIDSDTKLYGADCGFTDPKATPKDPPSTGDATFSRDVSFQWCVGLPLQWCFGLSFQWYIGLSFQRYIGLSFQRYIGLSFQRYIGLSFQWRFGLSFQWYIGLSFQRYIGLSFQRYIGLPFQRQLRIIGDYSRSGDPVRRNAGFRQVLHSPGAPLNSKRKMCT